MPLEKLEVEALELPVRERAHLARRLIESLDTNVTEDPAELEREWEAEIRRRLEEYRSGKVQPIPASQVMLKPALGGVGDYDWVPTRAAREELLAGSRALQRRNPKAGRGFPLTEVERAVERIAAFLAHGSHYLADTRQVLLRRFPFSVVMWPILTLPWLLHWHIIVDDPDTGVNGYKVMKKSF